MKVTETFFSVSVRDMERATSFYVEALSATVMAATPGWSSLWIAGVRIGLFLNAEHKGGWTGLHFVVSDLAEAGEEIERAGGHKVSAPIEAAPGVVIAQASDSEGNVFTMRGP